MKRSSFLKSLVGLIAAPAIAKEVVPKAVVSEVAAPIVGGVTQGAAIKCFVSSIDFLDEREINTSIFSRKFTELDMGN